MESFVIGWRPIGLSTEHRSPRAMSPSGQLAFHIPSKWPFNAYPAARISTLITRRPRHRTEINVKFVRRNIPKSSSQIFKAWITICPSNTPPVRKTNMLKFNQLHPRGRYMKVSSASVLRTLHFYDTMSCDYRFSEYTRLFPVTPLKRWYL